MRFHVVRAAIVSVIAALPLVFGFATSATAETTLCTSITKVPTVISRPGHYCLKKDLRFTPLDGVAIDVRAGNVLLDMNGFFLRGDVATTSEAVGIKVRNKPNVRIANGVITQFGIGLYAVASSGLLIENMNLLNAKEAAVVFERTKASILRDSRFLNNLVEAENGRAVAILVDRSNGTLIQNNDISNTGFDKADVINLRNTSGPQASVIVENNRISGAVDFAMMVFRNQSVVIRGNTFTNVVNGIFREPEVQPTGRVVVRDNTFLGVRGILFNGNDFDDNSGNVLN